jgi:predicted methyltransferase
MRLHKLAALLLLTLPGVSLAQSTTPAAYITAAVNDPARQADAANDARRKVGELMAFAQVKPGQSVLELIPGSGYFTRVFSAIVGASGHVYVVWPNEYLKEDTGALEKTKALVAQNHYANVGVLVQPAGALSVPQPVDLVFTSQNYHDYPDPFMGKVDPAVLNRQVFAALKPGGLYVIVDHVAAAGSGMRDTNTLHRIDPAIVKAQVIAAGFVFDGESAVLQNNADPHSNKVFDPSIRGRTDQFVYRFRKPVG